MNIYGCITRENDLSLVWNSSLAATGVGIPDCGRAIVVPATPSAAPEKIQNNCNILHNLKRDIVLAPL
jgi:hypothetical protein